jgi:NAD(P)-dependent dehydrogenase (short-subunit alcohol dehydrogenase family)
MSLRVVVTGGSGGIGSAICARLRRDGAVVAVIDRVAPTAACEAAVIADLDAEGTSRDAFVRAAAALGGADAIVNAIGIYECASLDEFSWRAYERNLQVNVRAPLEVILAWLATDPPRGGRIVNISSAAAGIGSRDLPYSISKAALCGASRSLARSLAPRGIAVFSISPGLIDTPMSQAMPAERRDGHARATLAQRSGRPDEIADLVHFLLYGQSDYMSGLDIPVASGLVW